MKNIYLYTKNKSECNGCGMCTLVCPKECIKMVEDEEGFLYPKIDENICIGCNKCKNTCSNINEKREYISKTYAMINKSEEELKQSSSGGIFYVLARYVIGLNGVVFGVKYTDQLIVKHDYAQTLEDCKKFMGSKYVRSDIDGIFKQVENFLKEDRYVLFTGTPCQCNALKIFLEKDYEKLLTCDIICHSNPSPKIFKKYIENIEKIKNKKVKYISFRNKEYGWKNSIPIITYEDDEKEKEKIYRYAFTSELIGRPSCHKCRFASFNRQSDITIGDLWSIKKFKDIVDNDSGISLCSINSLKGEKIFEDIKDNVYWTKIEESLAYTNNHYSVVKPNRNRNKIFKKIEDENIILYLEKYAKPSVTYRLIRKLKHINSKIIKK